MSAGRQEMAAALARQLEESRQAERAFLERHGPALESYRAGIADGLGEALAGFRRDVAEASGGNPACAAVAEAASGYLEWLQWTFWELPYFAVAVGADPARFRRDVASCGLVYLSFRFLDDVLDRHFQYRGRRPTLLAALGEDERTAGRAEPLATLAAVLVCFEGLGRLAARLDEGDGALTLRRVVGAARRALVGAVMEQSGPEAWDAGSYERLIGLKNVDYWRILYAAVDPGHASPLYPFLVDYYAVAQKINDVQEHAEDERRGQPNFVALQRRRSGEAAPGPALLAVEEALGRDLLALARAAAGLPEPERAIARLKLGEYIAEALRLGLFAPPAAGGPEPPRLGLSWTSDSGDFVERLGPDALEEVPCPVCAGDDRQPLFRKQGFAFQRCRACSHVYVSPRLRPELQARLGAELDTAEADPFLDAGKIYAGFLCQLLHRRGAGPRLLDVGFGQGYLLQVARAHGFEVYGIEGSAALVERLRPAFGNRLHHGWIGDGELPWGSFDVVVMSHVLEHLPDPGAALEQVRGILDPGGLLYVAVPDMGSVQYRVLGKRWEAIQPVVHAQYFTAGSLDRLLAACGFEEAAPIERPPFRRSRARGWQKLCRRLGGTESGDLALLARLPGDAGAIGEAW